ncbi:DUF2303 family protein [Pannonibacter tanglangensis]|uniref:DUF2303 family protein n=1 Tax=Pannonibacter tanglangensis TaxID=2750084 RepID=A0ABW9ZD92_9HYPH|nr:DUF2303 family protein [Pannonibacter sp. XCT-34]NBN62815.1 DUF2303 family protein [Pannonibacter sp. XCT-34]
MTDTAETPLAISLEGHSIGRIAELGQRAAGMTLATATLPEPVPGLPASIPIGITHEDEPKAIDLKPFFEKYRTSPEHARGTAVVLTLGSLIELVDRQRTRDTVIFADSTWTQPSITAVIDYHQGSLMLASDAELGAGTPGHGRSRIHYAFPLAEGWRDWTAMNGVEMDQRKFAEWIEDHIAELASPTSGEVAEYQTKFGTTIATPSDLMQLSRGLQVNVAATVKNAQTLQTGEASIQFEETHHGHDGKPLLVPGLFIVQTEVFFMGALVRVPVRLRYRVKGGQISWFFQMWRPDIHVTDRIRADLDVLREQLPHLPVIEGAPDMDHTGLPVPQPAPAQTTRKI